MFDSFALFASLRFNCLVGLVFAGMPLREKRKSRTAKTRRRKGGQNRKAKILFKNQPSRCSIPSRSLRLCGSIALMVWSRSVCLSVKNENLEPQRREDAKEAETIRLKILVKTNHPGVRFLRALCVFAVQLPCCFSPKVDHPSFPLRQIPLD